MGARGPKSAASVIDFVAPKPRAPVATPKAPAAPKHLSTATRKWWQEVVTEFALESHHLRLLQAACETWDRLQQAREALALHGLTYDDDKGLPRTRPEVAVERDSRIAFARLVRELDLDGEPPTEGRRPPAIKSNRG